jgi:hypothetical protein
MGGTGGRGPEGEGAVGEGATSDKDGKEAKILFPKAVGGRVIIGKSLGKSLTTRVERTSENS